MSNLPIFCLARSPLISCGVLKEILEIVFALLEAPKSLLARAIKNIRSTDLDSGRTLSPINLGRKTVGLFLKKNISTNVSGFPFSNGQ